MAGSGDLTLTNADNSYTGSTVVDTGNLVVTTNGATGPATAAGIYVNMAAPSAWPVVSPITMAEALSLAGNGNNNNGATRELQRQQHACHPHYPLLELGVNWLAFRAP